MHQETFSFLSIARKIEDITIASVPGACISFSRPVIVSLRDNKFGEDSDGNTIVIVAFISSQLAIDRRLPFAAMKPI
jgi:hypothetical protein